MKKYLSVVLTVLFVVAVTTWCGAWSLFGSSQPKFCGFQLGESFSTSKGSEAGGYSEVASAVGGKSYTVKRGEFTPFLNFQKVEVTTAKDGSIVIISADYFGSNSRDAFERACNAIETNYDVKPESRSSSDRIYYINRDERTYYRVLRVEIGGTGSVGVYLRSDKLIKEAQKANSGSSAAFR